MRAISCPTFRRLLLLSMGAAVVLACVGCARNASTVPPAKSVRPIVDASGKPEAANAKSQPSAQPKNSDPKFKVTEQEVTLHWKAKAGTQMSAKAKSASFNEISQTGSLLDFSGQLYENDKLTATMRAPKALADTAKRIVTATGGVTLKSLERETVVQASWMKWYANAHKVVGGGGVKITSTSGNLQGAAFVADTDLRTLTVKDSAKGLEY